MYDTGKSNHDQPLRRAAPALIEYWAALARPGEMPRRDMIDPNRIAGFLPDILLLETNDGGKAQIRIAGRQVQKKFQTALLGSCLTDHVVARDQAVIMSVMRELQATPARGAIFLKFGDTMATLTLLPLRGSAGRIDLALAHLDMDYRARSSNHQISYCGSFLRALKRPGFSAPHLKLVVDNTM